MSQFILGQRWISLSEPELGLGLVTNIEGRRVTLDFPLVEDNRVYSIGNTPLIRCIFAVNDRIQLISGIEANIISVNDESGIIQYQISEFLWAEEEDIAPNQGKVSPVDRLKAGQIGSFKWSNLYRRLLEAYTHQQGLMCHGFVGPKINIIPHQYDVAQQILNMPLPRALLADEVGLGKTIEAGLVIHQLVASQRAQRILICVPSSLVNQWLVEMKRKFNLDCTLIDDEFCAEQSSQNPFDQVQIALCNFDWLTHSQYLDQALLAQWDMMVVDESHRLQWQSKAYQSALALSKVSVGVLLLTATPEQLGVESHFARLHLLDPLRFPQLEQFLDEEQKYGTVSEIVESIEQDGLAVSLPLIEKLNDEKLNVYATTILENEKSESDFIDWMADRYGTGRMVYRNTRRSISGFPLRHSEFYHLKEIDTLDWLIDWLPSIEDKKILIICHSAETAQKISENINQRTLIQSGAFHEHYSLIERDQIAARFTEDDGIQILVCSEIGGEGRNFQHAQHLVLFDLPEHPDLVDQRIGRLDRIGQGSDIYIHIPVISGSKQSRLAALYHHGFDMFSQPNPAASPIFEAYGYEIEDMLDTGENAETVIMQAQQASKQLLEEIEQGRDRLLEQHSFQEDRISKLIDSINESDNNNDKLKQLVLDIFDNGHIDTEPTGNNNLIIGPQENCPFSFINSLRDEKATVTFDRQQASIREDLEFISWDHPWIKGIIDDLEASGDAFTSCALFSNPEFKNGQIFVETLYQVKAEGPGRLELNRHLTPELRHYVISEELKNVTRILDLNSMRANSELISKDMAREVIQMKLQNIDNAALLSEKLAAHTSKEHIENAINNLSDKSAQELERYKSLEISPGSYQLEIDTLTKNTKEATEFLSATKPKLLSMTLWINFNQ
ncbi:RNA polymerase-associated protein RapA [Oceaniserpentilla sp. 4NH20-0058]|uniref:SNF2-related protein n=1 Tax=Oceaniserpentilla sp. 4NH20-0058 TaxID=3127660 RepID=UPI003107783B